MISLHAYCYATSATLWKSDGPYMSRLYTFRNREEVEQFVGDFLGDVTIYYNGSNHALVL